MNEQLANRIRQCSNLPTLPAIAMQVLELAQSADVNIPEIASTISKDPALSTKILRTVNSSFYARSENVSTISNALVILGLQSVKTLVLGFSLVNNLVGGKEKGFNHLTYWRRSLYSATAARTIASKIGLVQQEEAFLSSLLKDIGMLVLDQVIGAEYAQINASVVSHVSLAEAERQAIGADHAEVGAFLTQSWKLPPLLTVPIAHHHAPEGCLDPSLRKLTHVVHLSGRCADVFVDAVPGPAIAEVRQICARQFQMTEADCDALMAEIGQKTKETASLFEIQIGSAITYQSILKKANETLVELTLQTQQQASSLREEASTLAEQNIQLKKQATTDGLTGLANRASFDKFLTDTFDVAFRDARPISLLMLDVDRFKAINDRHGHQVGDKVLQSLGQLWNAAARPQDLAARYGGEEMCLILPGTGRGTAAAIAESIRRAICMRPLLYGALSLPVTASIGVATFEPNSPLRLSAHLLKAADLAVYNAKHAGRNCVRVFTLSPNKASAA